MENNHVPMFVVWTCLITMITLIITLIANDFSLNSNTATFIGAIIGSSISGFFALVLWKYQIDYDRRKENERNEFDEKLARNMLISKFNLSYEKSIRYLRKYNERTISYSEEKTENSRKEERNKVFYGFFLVRKKYAIEIIREIEQSYFQVAYFNQYTAFLSMDIGDVIGDLQSTKDYLENITPEAFELNEDGEVWEELTGFIEMSNFLMQLKIFCEYYEEIESIIIDINESKRKVGNTLKYNYFNAHYKKD